MSTRWFRWYQGTVEDGKFRTVTRKSRVTIRDTLAMWAVILEDAADLAHPGVCKRDVDYFAAVLDFDADEPDRIIGAMEAVGLIDVDVEGGIVVSSWDKRQFKSDIDATAAQRQARRRAAGKTKKTSRRSHAGVTRESHPPEAEAEADTYTPSPTEKAAAPAASAAKKDPPSDPNGGNPHGSDEDRFFHLFGQLQQGGVEKSLLGKLTKLLAGNYAKGLGILQRASRARRPAGYIAKTVRDIEREHANDPPIAAAPPRADGVPAWVAEKRAEGGRVSLEETNPNRWRWGSELYDDAGQFMGM